MVSIALIELQAAREQDEEAIENATQNAYRVRGKRLKSIKESKSYVTFAPTWTAYCKERWEMTKRRADQFIEAFTVTATLKETLSLCSQNESSNSGTKTEIVPVSGTNVPVSGTKTEIVPVSEIEVISLPSREAHVRPLSKLDTPEQQADVWRRVVDSGQTITAKLVQEEVDKKLVELDKMWYTVEEWDELDEDQQLHLWELGDESITFNRTNENIEWAAWSWNPVTGCEHDCFYCYARDIAKRFYPQVFVPSLYPRRLCMPENTSQIPPRWPGDKGNSSVFVCSMADLFGEWVPDEWIDIVMDTVRDSPQWTYVFLTKNPQRLVEIEWPNNAWVGTTVDTQERAELAEVIFSQFDAPVKFLSCEPLRERLTFNSLKMFDWVIIGGQSKSSQAPEFQPPFEWVWWLTNQAYANDCKVYWKTNLESRPRNYPDIT